MHWLNGGGNLAIPSKIRRLNNVRLTNYTALRLVDTIEAMRKHIEALQAENEQLKADLRGKDNEINDLKALIEYLRKFKPKKNETVREAYEVDG